MVDLPEFRELLLGSMGQTSVGFTLGEQSVNSRIYLDYNATTPMAPEVAKAMSPYFEEAYGNPSSLHWAGTTGRIAVAVARSQVASLLNCDATEVIFTSGGTEANNLVIKGLYFARYRAGKPFHIITSQIEHPAVLKPCGWLETLGAQVTRLSVDCYGHVDPADVRSAMRPDTALVSVMHANNEVGTIQSIAEISAIARDHGALCHTDAAQTAGKISVDVKSLGVDLLSIAGHKLYGPKGVGALFVRDGVELEPLLHGAGHELGRRAGTENVLSIIGLGVACELAQRWIGDTTCREAMQCVLAEVASSLRTARGAQRPSAQTIAEYTQCGFRRSSGAGHPLATSSRGCIHRVCLSLRRYSHQPCACCNGGS